mgnify:CR=1 FL=1
MKEDWICDDRGIDKLIERQKTSAGYANVVQTIASLFIIIIISFVIGYLLYIIS